MADLLLTGYTRSALLAERVGHGAGTGNSGAGGDATAYTEVQVTTSADSGAGSLRTALNTPSSWVTFAPNLGELRLLSDIPYRENTVIDGRGSGSLWISNYGFINTVTPRGNVIITDMTFDYRQWWAGNSPPVSATNGPGGFVAGWPTTGANDYWYNHLRYMSNSWASGGGTGFDDDGVNLSSGDDGSTNGKRCTISWCHFPWTYKPITIGNSQLDTVDLVTIHHNFFDGCWSRSPLCRNARIHYFNNWVNSWRSAGVGLASNVNFMGENNIFDRGIFNLDGITNGNGAVDLSSFDDIPGTVTAANWTGTLTSGGVVNIFSVGTAYVPSGFYSYTADTANAALRTALSAGVGPRTNSLGLPPAIVLNHTPARVS